MESHIYYIFQLSVIIAGAYIGAFISEKLRQPAVLGQIFVGLLLGMFLTRGNPVVEGISQIGVVMLMFIAGMETDVKQLMKSLGSTSLIALGGILSPLAFVYLAISAFLPEVPKTVAIMLGIVTTATSVSISVQTLREINMLRSRVGVAILGAAIIDDILGIIALSLFIAMFGVGAASGGHAGDSPMTVVVNIILFFVIVFVAGFLLVKGIALLQKKMDPEKHLIALSLSFCLGLAFLSEEMGVAAITGAYFAGIIFSMTDFKHQISHEISHLSGNFFTPVFFVKIGLSIDINAALSSLLLGTILVVMGNLGKYIGCGIMAYLRKFSLRESHQIGIGMMPRAEVAIIVAGLGFQMGILDESGVAAAILMVLVTTLVTPIMLKASFKHQTEELKS